MAGYGRFLMLKLYCGYLESALGNRGALLYLPAWCNWMAYHIGWGPGSNPGAGI